MSDVTVDAIRLFLPLRPLPNSPPLLRPIKSSVRCHKPSPESRNYSSVVVFAMDSRIKSEPLEFSFQTPLSMPETSNARSVIDLISSSDSDSNDDGLCGTVSSKKRNRVSNAALEAGPSKKKRLDDEDFILPAGFLDPLPSAHAVPVLQPPPISQVPPAMHQPLPVLQAAPPMSQPRRNVSRDQACKQFWKAGDYEMDSLPNSNNFTGGIDHVRVHPKFLHSNATSHKWALGAFAELLDNSLDEVCNGATYVNIDMLESRKDGSKMLLIEDNGGGMDPEKTRQCMSLGYSAKSKQANTIGQYGNGFKTSTMRLGADVLVFSRCCGKDGKSPTQSIGMLSYTFLRSTKREDIIVPMVDYEKEGKDWRRLIRSSPDDWARIAETIVQWSPYFSEEDLLLQFHSMTDHGTRIIIYNLWEDDRGELELDFGADQFDIQLRGVNREDKKIQMAAQFPNSKHFLTYRHSLRSYASILYLRLPPRFRIVLRGKDVEHHNILNDMMMVQEHTYRPQASADGVPRDPADMVAVVKLGFVKDAENHIDVQGFNVYHKNRLIKPFWRLWNPAGSDGRGVIGLLEANFVEPAHDKQGFERTTVLQRLETRLVQMQKQYWCENCHKIGYAPRRSKKLLEVYSDKQEAHTPSSVVPLSMQPQDPVRSNDKCANRRVSTDKSKFGKKSVSPTSRFRDSLSPEGYESDYEIQCHPHDRLVDAQCKGNGPDRGDLVTSPTRLLEEENHKLTERLTKLEESKMLELQFERDKNKSLEAQIRDLERKLDEANKEQEALIDIFSEERSRRDRDEDNLRRKLKDASNTIQELLDKEMTMCNGIMIKRE